MRLTPTQRAAVVRRQAQLLGEGQAVTRAQVTAELFSVRKPSPIDIVVSVLPPAVEPAPAPVDQEVTFEVAAARLRLTASTVRQYCAPSKGRLRRLGHGVSLDSIRSFEGRQAQLFT
ncbi:hypothetical protein [Parafrankia sp. EUN1f]|uniref:hypothetical protein n=1 Tax=Parafrankia sp. EUN1f TaxID=102897 RepID=UPI0001C4556F|nr:hypothetical protein [Parafrankia sp. EUN1f]EFC86454.1 hypothetical protein FrEUN1fDRAFT_0349 [Parafrankia sp. EUN1f]